MQIILSVVMLEREPGLWVAQCLEVNLGAQAGNPEDLDYEFQKVVAGHLAICKELDRTPFEDLGEVPREYWDM